MRIKTANRRAIRNRRRDAYREWQLLPDNCQICFGVSGGVRGNENRVGDLVVCDYCYFSMEIQSGLIPLYPTTYIWKTTKI